MGYRNLHQCIKDLESTKQLIRIDQEIDANLEAGAIQRRVYRAGGPALLFTRVKNCQFPMVANLFGTIERTRTLFRDTLQNIESFIRLKIDPHDFFKHPLRYRRVPKVLYHLRPKWVRSAPVLQYETTISSLPQLKSWPLDGGAYITLPQVYTEHPGNPGFPQSNLGMYRVQLSGNRYKPDEEIGIHYQLHRGIGIHHAEALRLNKPFHVNIFVGGAPAMTLASVMPLPEGLSELFFAGALGGHRIPMITKANPLPIYAEADFCITGIVEPDRLLPEGPFGDHLGFYSLQHPYPVLKVQKVYHRKNAIWPFTTVGRPPQEDTVFGKFIHELTRSIVPSVIPGVKAVHAVDAAGVHPLLLAIGSERYTPFQELTRPQELLTQANAILGNGQLSLAKYLWICAGEDDPTLHVQDIPRFFQHILERVDWKRDLHFQTQTTMDSLDYSGQAVNQGSKVVIAAVGAKKRELPSSIASSIHLPPDFGNLRIIMPGILLIKGPRYKNGQEMDELCNSISKTHPLISFPLWVIVDDPDFASRSFANFLWVAFTRSNPADDLYGIGSFTEKKHWGCAGPLIMDARAKPNHAPALEDDPDIEKKVDQLGAPGGPLYGII